MHSFLRILSLSGIALTFLGAGCTSNWSSAWQLLTDPAATTSSTTPTSSPRASWQEIEPGLERLEAAISSSTGATVLLYRMAPDRYQARVDHVLPPQNVSVWNARTSSTSIVVNGVYFHEDYLPSGALRIGGTRIGARQFDLDKSGTILFDPLRLVDTKEYAIALDQYSDAVQSYPFLLKRGSVAVKEESGKVARRTFLGLDRAGRMYVGIVPYASVSLRELALALTALPVEWTNVLNLDGGPSTGLSVHARETEELFDSYVPVPNVIRFTSIKNPSL